MTITEEHDHDSGRRLDRPGRARWRRRSSRGPTGHDRSGDFVAESIELLRTNGFLAAPVPRELGGGGASHAEACAVLRRLGRACGATAVTLSMHYHLTCTQVWRHRHGQPAEAILRGSRRRTCCWSPPARPTGWARPARHRRSTAGSGCRPGRHRRAAPPPATCWSPRSAGTTHPTARRSSTARCRSPPTASRSSAPGTRMGLRGTGSDTVVLDDVFVPDAAVSLVRPADVWHPVWSTVLGTALPLIMSAYLGIADRAVEEAVRLASARADRPLTAGAGRRHAAPPRRGRGRGRVDGAASRRPALRQHRRGRRPRRHPQGRSPPTRWRPRRGPRSTSPAAPASAAAT